MNQDRHDGNVIFHEELGLWLIDHEQAMGGSATDLASVLPSFLESCPSHRLFTAADLDDDQLLESLPQWAHLRRDAFEGWVGYYRRKAAENRWEDVEQLHRRRPGNFYVELGGYEESTNADWTRVADGLFAELVDKPSKRQLTPDERLDGQVAELLKRAGVTAERKVMVIGKFGRELLDIPFGYRYVNGSVHLMDSLRGSSVERLASNARELQSRMAAARLAGSASDFITFFSTSGLKGRESDRVLYPAATQSHIIDADDEAAAVVTIKHLMVDA